MLYAILPCLSITTTPRAEPPAKWKGLIGEYGWDHNTLFVYERDGKLHCLIEWTEIYGTFWAERFTLLKDVLKEIEP